ncbi:MAG: hypothetical protein ABIR37_02180 [Candidatus Saccharimonadales bacterium]
MNTPHTPEDKPMPVPQSLLAMNLGINAVRPMVEATSDGDITIPETESTALITGIPDHLRKRVPVVEVIPNYGVPKLTVEVPQHIRDDK